MTVPQVVEHEGIFVVRDDLYPGGTKARYIAGLFDEADEIVYGSPAEGGAQTALAQCAAAAGKKATIFLAKRAQPHARAFMAKRLGAKVVQVSPGYLSVVQARAKAYAEHVGATLAPFGMDFPKASEAITEAALSTGLDPQEVWAAAGSGTLARGLARAWPGARLRFVQVGREITPAEIGNGEVIAHPLAFSKECKSKPPFPSDPHYDAKAWEMCKAQHGAGLVLFWNVTGPAE